MRCHVRVPGSTSNLGAGFDCLGLALDWGLEVEVDTTPEAAGVTHTGPVVPARAAPNAVVDALRSVLAPHGVAIESLAVRITSTIPLSRGLGSSAAATLAGLLAGRLVAEGGEPDLERVLRDAAATEGHPDNAAAALHGGLVASAVDGDTVRFVRLPFPADLAMVALVPDRAIETRRARAILPPTVPLADAVFNLQRLALLAGGLASGDLDAFAFGLADRLHQDRRLQLVPGLGDAFAALRAEPAAAGVVLSGSGSTLLAFVRAAPPEFGAAAVAALARQGVASSLHRVRASPAGAAWRRDGDPQTS